ncbi:MAG: site-specific integrase [Desulfuromonas sp.]
MATIQERKRKDGAKSYKAIIRIKGYKTQTASFERKTDARLWVQQTEAAIREGRHFKTREAKRHTIADLIDRYVDNVLPCKSRIMVEKQRFQYQWWKDNYGYMVLSELTPSRIVEAREYLAKEPLPEAKSRNGNRKRSPASVNRYLAALSHALTIAVNEWGWLEDNPMRNVSRMKESSGRIRFLNDSERKRLLEACADSSHEYLHLIVLLALSTGARKMEILNLRWNQVDINNKAIYLTDTKNGENRRLHVYGYALDELKRLSKVRRIDTNLVFPGKNRSSPCVFYKPWKEALIKANIEDFRFHDLRHSAASYLAMSGATPSEIADILGHKTLQMVKRYAHLSDSHVSSVVQRMNDKFLQG